MVFKMSTIWKQIKTKQYGNIYITELANSNYVFNCASISTYLAVNHACLVFDKQLVIDTNFRTSDPCIRAAGPATKYPRILHNDKFTHGLLNSLEIGQKVSHDFQELRDSNIIKRLTTH